MYSSAYGLIFSILPLAGVAVASALISTQIPFFRRLTSPQPGRFGDLDGLRGLLAVGVFVHHSIFIYHLYATGRWSNPDPTVLQFAGRGSVAFFFMITGFLFWTKAIRARNGIPFVPFIRSRMRRLMSAYLVSVAVIFVIVAWKSGFELRESPLKVAWQAGRWLLGGLGGVPLINGQNTFRFNSGVTWTLQYEWIFYLLLPFMAFLSRSFWRFVFLAVAAIGLLAGLILTSLVDRTEISASFCFIWGMLAAHLYGRPRTREIVGRPWFPVCAVLLVLVAILAFHKLVYSFAMILCFPFFLAVLYRRVISSLLQSRPAVFLGHISYSLYLLHGLVLFLSTEAFTHWVPVSRLSPMAYSAICFVIAAVLVALAAISYRFVEHPWLAASPSTGKLTANAVPLRASLGTLETAGTSADQDTLHAGGQSGTIKP